ncbi:type VI secretion system accessory protein TagJ [Variovorax sp. PBL-E5]|uniref:type VI secretion system accessory protein TagJ n=1 Tax=Variovorax sp. PBL-E5 TaxID=434014 RepID=UPI00131918F5|nr:type VI secretion system accessory protein TagJ [Variovorax sp. PBL-E5]VTU38955.1 Protein of avirulence locus involved in temperature-dependent protein secretion [Variovorax sp. PBL-E5]
MTLSAELLQAADPTGALRALSDEVRAKPGDSKLRVFMAQLLCVLGQWERALNQLNVAAELDALAVPMKQVYGEAIRCEGLRADVFAGTRTPMVFGQPDEWLALLIESLLRQGRGEAAMAEDLRQRAFDAAPGSAGTLDGQPFEWLADADMRLGPVLEAFVNGRYYWVPFARLAHIKFDPPEDLRDAVWLPAHLQFENGGETLALVPARYEGTEKSGDGALQLARKTEWRELRPEVWAGLGQRMWSSDAGEHALLDVREILFDAAAASPAEGRDG